MLMHETETITITTDTAGAGAATGNATSEDKLNGLLLGYAVDYGSAPATTVITVAAVGAAADGGDLTLFVSAAGNTDGFYMPRKAEVKSADGTAAGTYDRIPVTGRKLKVTVTLADNSNVIKVRFWLLKE